MLILSQKGNVMVNMDHLQTITTYIFGDYQNGKKSVRSIVLWHGTERMKMTTGPLAITPLKTGRKRLSKKSGRSMDNTCIAQEDRQC